MTEEIKEDVKEKDEQEQEQLAKKEIKEEKPEKEGTLKLPDPQFEIIDGIKYPKKLMEEARNEGWRERDFLKGVGKDNKYLSPDKFVERGRKAVPFLNQKLNDRDKEIKTLKKLLKRQIKTQVIDKMEDIDEKLQEASEMGEVKKVVSMTRKKMELEKELAELKQQEEIKPPIENQQPKKHPDIIKWEMRNEWSYDPNNPKTIKANQIFNKIKIRYPRLSIKEALDLVDDNLKDYEITNRQKKNLSAPIGKTKSSSEISKFSRKISNLKPAMKKQFEKHSYDNNGNKFKGKTLELVKEAFLKACDDSHFNK
jgi:hypothetical protein